MHCRRTGGRQQRGTHDRPLHALPSCAGVGTVPAKKAWRCGCGSVDIKVGDPQPCPDCGATGKVLDPSRPCHPLAHREPALHGERKAGPAATRRRVLTRNMLDALLGRPFQIASCEPRQDAEFERLGGTVCGGIEVEIKDDVVGCPCEFAPDCRFLGAQKP